MRLWQQAKPGKFSHNVRSRKNMEGNSHRCAVVLSDESVAVSWTVLTSNLSGSRQLISEWVQAHGLWIKEPYLQ